VSPDVGQESGPVGAVSRDGPPGSRSKRAFGVCTCACGALSQCLQRCVAFWQRRAADGPIELHGAVAVKSETWTYVRSESQGEVQRDDDEPAVEVSAPPRVCCHVDCRREDESIGINTPSDLLIGK